MESLIIYHTQNKQAICSDWLEEHGFILWETCVRQIVIGTTTTDHLEGFNCLKAIKAYRFILEVICGLHSPMIGETEVLAQFKNFVKLMSSDLKSHVLDQHFWDGLLKDAKLIRSKYFKSYGQQSYGGIVLQSSVGFNSVHILGSGQLTSSILPHFSKEKRQVNILCRNHIKGEELKVKYPVIEHVKPLNSIIKTSKSLLVVAAPITTSNLEHFILENKNSVSGVIDLRSKQDHKVFNMDILTNYIDLDQVFAQVQSGINKAKKNAELSKVAIARRSFMWPLKALHRPNGWEDACA